MKILYFDDFKLGVLRGEDEVVDVSAEVQDIPHTGPHDLINGLIARFDDYRGRLETAVADGPGIPLNDVRIRPPLPRPGNIDCMAVNYMENGTRTEPAQINAFNKAGSTVIGEGDTMVLQDIPATIFEGEAELGLVIGKRAENVSQADAWDHIFGYFNFIDGSARDLPTPFNVFFEAKNRATFAPLGPWLVTADEFDDPQNLDVKLWVNGDLMQDFNTDDMAHKIPRLVEYLSSVHPLEVGDVIATGTNHRGLNPFQDGDKIELEIEGCGRLTINVRDDLKRTWARVTRLKHTESGAEGRFTPQLTGKYAPGS
ncbi:MAG: fumarylacetoacetate hydrolase [Alphaproteobacteria bacterium]|nr:fumarylacetoacetate hydrolase [Alphaproteobacteria bacterium]|tara:strand:+ start:2415 stop:3353 length:939 start_codon:yes stop_codon:yes gene_type:complete